MNDLLATDVGSDLWLKLHLKVACGRDQIFRIDLSNDFLVTVAILEYNRQITFIGRHHFDVLHCHRFADRRYCRTGGLLSL